MAKLKKRLVKVSLNKNKNFFAKFFLIAVLILLIFFGIFYFSRELFFNPNSVVLTLPTNNFVTNLSNVPLSCQVDDDSIITNLQIFVWDSSGKNLFQPVMTSHNRMGISGPPVFDDDGNFYTFKYRPCTRDSYCPESSAEEVTITKYSSNLALVWRVTLDRNSAGIFAEPNTLYYYQHDDLDSLTAITPNGFFLKATANNLDINYGTKKFVLFKLNLNSGAVLSVTDFNTEYGKLTTSMELRAFKRGNNLYQLKEVSGNYFLQKFDFNLNKIDEKFLYSPPKINSSFTGASHPITFAPIGTDFISLQLFSRNGTDLLLTSHVIFDSSNNIVFKVHNKSMGVHDYGLIATPDANKDLYYFKKQKLFPFDFFNFSLYKFNSSFDVIWNRDLLDKNENFNNTFFTFLPEVSFVLDNSNQFIFSGVYNLNFNNSVLGKNLVKDFFIGKYSKNGNLLWKFFDEQNYFPIIREQGKTYGVGSSIKIVKGNFLKIYYLLVESSGSIPTYYMDYSSFALPEKELVSTSQMNTNFYFSNYGNYKIGCLGLDSMGNEYWSSNSTLTYVSGPTTPLQTCGNSLIEHTENCDDGNLNNNDGCSISCQVENGWACSGIPSVCSRNIICSDSDGGLNYYLKGNVSGNIGSGYPDGLAFYPDLCLNSTSLIERYCTTSFTNFSFGYTCSSEGKVCQDGACVSVSCSVNLQNNTFAWQNVSCLTNNKMNQSRIIVQYDSNDCGTYTNQTFVEYRQTEGCNYCTEIILGPLTTECNSSNKYTKYWTSNYESCCAITRIKEDCQISNFEYENQTLNCVFAQSDVDLDGIDDSVDNLLWNQSYVATNLNDLVIKANGIVAHGSFDGPKAFSFFENSSVSSNDSTYLMKFDYNVSKKIDLSKLFLNLTDNLFVFNSLGQVNDKKIVLFPKKNLNVNSICVKNSEIFSESEFSSNCGATDEINFRSCIGGSVMINGVACFETASAYYFGGDLIQANVLFNGIEFCGDYICNNGESCSTCSNDCGDCTTEFCGDGSCNNGESCSTCSNDCGSCGSGGGGGGGGSSVKVCNDKKDNDKDGLIDFPADPGCINKYDADERNPVLSTRNYTYTIPDTSLENGTIEVIITGIEGEEPEKKLSKKSLAILISIIILIVLVLLGILFYFYWKKRKQNQPSTPVQKEIPKPSSPKTKPNFQPIVPAEKTLGGTISSKRSFKEQLRDL